MYFHDMHCSVNIYVHDITMHRESQLYIIAAAKCNATAINL
jgi:hypothetical protein